MKTEQDYRWTNPYIARIAQVDDRIPINSSLLPLTLDAEKVEVISKRFQAVYCELGSGSGKHLLACAERDPTSCFFGVELRFKRAYRTVEKALQYGLDNVFVLRTNASFLSTIFQNVPLQGIFMNFPDPWERKKWKKHRMFSESFLDASSSLLRDRGFISFKTDHEEYFTTALQLVNNHSSFELVAHSFDLSASLYEKDNISTEFESLFRSQRLPIYYLKAEKVRASAATTVY